MPRSAHPHPDPAPPAPLLTDDQKAALDAALATKRKEKPGARDPGAGGGLFAPRAPRPIPGRGGAAAPTQPISSSSAPRSFDRHTPRSGWGGRGGPKKGGAGGRFTWGAAGAELADEAAWAGLRVGSAPRGASGGWHPNAQAPSGPLAVGPGGGGEGALGRRRSIDRGASGSLGSGSHGGPGGAHPALTSPHSWRAHHHGQHTPDPAIALDRGDPNYDSDDAAVAGGRVALSPDLEGRISAYKRGAFFLLTEFFDSGDVRAAGEGLAGLGAPGFDAFFVKKAVTAALDRGAREREAVSRLLCALCAPPGPATLPGSPSSHPSRPLLRPAALAAGFRDLAACTDDLALDVPGAHSLVATFTARAVADDVLPPAFLDTLPPSGGGGAGAVRAAAADALAAPHAAERLARCWGAAVAADAAPDEESEEEGEGGGDGLARRASIPTTTPASPTSLSTSPPLVVGRFAAVRAAVAALVSEFLASGDVAEAGACLRSLAVPFAHHEAVKQAVTAALEAALPPLSPRGGEGGGDAPAPKPNPTASAVSRLLASWAASGLVSASQMAAGFERVGAGLEDIALDAPGARPALAALVAEGLGGGWLDPGAGSAAGRAAGLIVPLEEAGAAPPPPTGDGASSSSDAALTAAAVAGLEAEAAAAAGSSSACALTPSTARALSYKAAATAAVCEFFESGDVDAADAALRGAAVSAGHASGAAPAPLGALAVKAAVRVSLDRRGREREATARLLPALVSRGCLPATAIAAGFARLLGGAEDLTLDAPGAPSELATFLARAVADGLLPASFLASIVPALRPGCLGVAVVEAAGAHLAARGGGGRVRGAWVSGGGGGGGGSGAGGGDAAVAAAAAPTAAGLRSALRSLLDSFYDSPGDATAAATARAALRDLAAPFYHHELVRAALADAATRDEESDWDSQPAPALPPTAAAAVSLLASLAASGDVSATQAAAGLDRFESGLEALSIELGPGVRARAGAVVEAARKAGALPAAEEGEE